MVFIITIMIFFVLSYMYYVFLVNPNTKPLSNLGFVGAGVIFGDDELNHIILSIDKAIDLSVSSALIDLGKNGGVFERCDGVWDDTNCKPTIDLVESEFIKYFRRNLRTNLGKFIDDSSIVNGITFSFLVESKDKKIRIYGKYNIGKPGIKEGFDIKMIKKKNVDKSYDYDLDFYNSVYSKYTNLDTCPGNDNECQIEKGFMKIKKETQLGLISPIINGKLLGKQIALSEITSDDLVT